MKNKHTQNIAVDIIWYMIGSAIPMLVAFIRSPIYTRIFTPKEYGYYSLTFIAFNYLSIVFFSWISSCVWRYYNQYKIENRLPALFSSVAMLFAITAILLSLITLVWYMSISNTYIKTLVSLSYFHFLTNELIAIILIKIRIEGKAFQYNLINSLRTLISFGLLLFMTFKLNHKIEAFLSSVIYINLFTILGLILFLKRSISLNFKNIRTDDIYTLCKYGIVGFIANLSALLLATSDRYIIKLYDTIDHVGIYNQVYNLGQVSITGFVYVFFAAINPVLLAKFENDFENSNHLTRNYIRLFIYMLLPLTVYFSIFSKQIADILLGEKFRIGYTMIPYIMVSSFVYGLTLFHETKLKFANAFRSLIIGFIIATAINIGLNLVLIPIKGYEIAAFNTLIAYLFLGVYFYMHDTNKFFSDKNYLKNISPIILILVVQFIIDFFLRNILKIEINLFYTIIEGTIFTVSFLLLTRIYLRTTLRNIHYNA